MDDAGLMRGVESRRHLFDQGIGGGDRQPAFARDPGRQRLAFDELHREEMDLPAIVVGVNADFEDAADVGMSDLARQLHLAAESPHETGIVAKLATEGLERDGSSTNSSCAR